MQGRDQKTIWELRQTIQSLENDKRMLEKRLKFKDILGDMRNSTQVQEEDILNMKKHILALQKENQELKKKKTLQTNVTGIEEEIKTIQKMLKNERKMHEADLAVLTNLQSVRPLTNQRTSRRWNPRTSI